MDNVPTSGRSTAIHSTAREGAVSVRTKDGTLIQLRLDTTGFGDAEPRYIDWRESELQHQQRIAGH